LEYFSNVTDYSIVEYTHDLATSIEDNLTSLEVFKKFSFENSNKGAILTIHSGAGGVESQDFTLMLLRMYLNWITKKGFKYDVLEQSYGDKNGLKYVTLEIKNEYSYGYLKGETGIHRLQRISPYDANKNRQTSFASVTVYPDIEEIRYAINEDDVEFDSFRAGGKGGQYTNKTNSAVRLKHKPSGITVKCQTERSQFSNRDSAMKLLSIKVNNHYKALEEERIQDGREPKAKIEWGGKIRTYSIDPYKMVKDTRTGFETNDTDSIFNGNIDDMLDSYLLSK
jgi:peptide chain release factor 2